eukprot:COSAG06_NODE_6176_length_3067_cov_6.619272_2_plen_274_part_00
MGKGAKKEPEDSEQPQPSEPRTAPGGDAAGDGEDSDVVGLDSGNSRSPKRTLLIGVGAAWVLFAVLCVVLLASSSDDETGEDAPDAVVIDFSTDAATTLSGSAADNVRNETCFAAGPGLSLLYTTFWNSSRPDAGCIGAVQSCAGATGACAAGSLGACSDSDCAVRTQGRLNVEVTGMHSGPGRVRLGVASSSGQWNRGQPQWRSPSLVKTDVAPQRGTVDISIDDIPFGVCKLHSLLLAAALLLASESSDHLRAPQAGRAWSLPSKAVAVQH